MEIQVLTFGAARDMARSGMVGVPYVTGMTVANLVDELKVRYPRLNELTSFAIAVNGAYASKETVIAQGDEVAIIPPVSGG